MEVKNDFDLKKILDNFKNIKIGVVGDLMLDDYIYGTVERISPEAPVPVVNVKEEKFVLGGAANVVNNLASLGAKTICFGVIGNDANGERLLGAFADKKIDVSGLIRDKERTTIVKRRIIGSNQQLLRIDWEDITPISTFLEYALLRNIESKIDELDAVILSDYDKGVLTPMVAKEIVRMCRDRGKIVTVDPKPKNAMNYYGATSMTPNRKEAKECLGMERATNMEEVGKELKEKLKLDNLLLTRSEEGMSLFIEDKIVNIPTFAKEVYDVTGAGDTVISVFTLAAASGVSWHEAAKIANTAAGVVVGKMGTSTVTKDEILEFYKRIYERWE
ncbi:D-glycero-beta-D-manno-heptose-7-phosphate kinase [uncultured Fusobacterium sp.]|jgi:rfaE bifunctional protein kinase chain/domain|uniref:D-glycero-beta-D-manno-heptose-7-phosphate kinase n=1 Tax=uncultured Fusobacterium sp. TaxID=159267 RepID=UPI0025E8A710|nr:D-glycero-beta-D-manno-heptose-7-phosphate kinase [uncultured Fusobacterium sp.]MCF2639481.1 D-glycero-beta-D-manno-heptose-7-phosphate kinase [Fusobacterium varium]